MTSAELSMWQALYHVKADEHEERKLIAESGDGQVYISGREAGVEPDDDGEAE